MTRYLSSLFITSLFLSLCFSAATLATLGSLSPDPHYSISVTGALWGSQQSPLLVSPGTMNNPFTVYLTNLGSLPALNVTVTLSTSYPFSSPTNSPNVSNTILNLLPTATLPTTFYLNIASNSSTGIYTLPVNVAYLLNGTNFTLDTNVQLPVTTSPDLTIQNAFWGSPSSPTLVGPGSSFMPLVMNVKNVGDNNAYDTNVTIHLSSPFYYNADGLQTEETAQLGIIPAGSILPAIFTVSVEPSIQIGEYPMNVTLNYNNGIVHDQTVQVPVLGSPNIVEQSYAIQQGNIFPGDNNIILTVYIVNSGNLTANNVQAQLLIPSPLSPSSPGSDRTTIGIMPPGQPVPVEFLFNVPSSISSPANLQLPLQITYGSQEAIYHLPVTISGMPSFTISDFTQSPNQLPILDQGASDVTLNLAITNIGNYTAKYVNAQLLLPNDLTGTTFTFLGNMAPSGSNMATFALDVSSSAIPGTYYSTLRVTWLQDNAPGRQFTQDIPIGFQVQQSALSSLTDALTANLAYIVIVIVVIIAVLVGVRFVLSRRKK